MGLLDGFNDDNTRFSLGLLAAAGPRFDGAGIGQRMQEALGSVDAYKQKQQALQLQNLQLQQSKQKFDMIKGIMDQLGGGKPDSQPVQPAKIGQLGSGTYGMGFPMQEGTPEIPEQPRAPASSRLANMTPEQIAMFKMATGEDLSPIWKTAKEGFERKPGSFYEDMQGRRSYIGDPTKGFNVDGAGNVGVMPGYLGAQAAITGATEGAKQVAVNANTLLSLDRIDPETGRPYGGTVGQMVSRFNQPDIPVASGSAPPSAQAAAAIAADIAKNGNPNPVYNSNYSTQRAQPPMAGNGGRFNGFAGPDDLALGAARVKLETEPKLKAATDIASGAASEFNTYKKSLDDNVAMDYQMVNRNKQIAPLLEKFKTGMAGAEGRLKLGSWVANSGMFSAETAKSLGASIAGGDVTAGKVIENQLAAAGISTMLTTLEKEAQPNRAMFNAVHAAQESLNSGNLTLKDVFELQNRLYKQHYTEQQALNQQIKNGTLNHQTWMADYSAKRDASLNEPAAPLPSVDTPSKTARTVVNDLPKMAAKGSRIRDTATNQVLVFDGLKWKAE